MVPFEEGTVSGEGWVLLLLVSSPHAAMSFCIIAFSGSRLLHLPSSTDRPSSAALHHTSKIVSASLVGLSKAWWQGQRQWRHRNGFKMLKCQTHSVSPTYEYYKLRYYISYQHFLLYEYCICCLKRDSIRQILNPIRPTCWGRGQGVFSPSMDNPSWKPWLARPRCWYEKHQFP